MRQRRLFTVLRAALVLLIVLALALTAAWLPYRLWLPAYPVPPRAEGELRVHFLSVGQGDCTLVEFPSGTVFLIDGGDGSFEHDNLIVRYLKGVAPTSLIVAATHTDRDHVGGLAEVLRVFRAEKAYLPTAEGTGDYARFLEAAAQSGCARAPLMQGACFLDGSGAYMVCLSPAAAGDGGNEDAATFYLAYEGVRMLLCADASAEQEAAILSEFKEERTVNGFAVDLAAVDVLKVAHHGAADATSEAWLKTVRPREAVISCGAGNTYGHPAGETLERLDACGTRVLRTDVCGNVVVSVKDGAYTVSPEKG